MISTPHEHFCQTEQLFVPASASIVTGIFFAATPALAPRGPWPSAPAAASARLQGRQHRQSFMAALLPLDRQLGVRGRQHPQQLLRGGGAHPSPMIRWLLQLRNRFLLLCVAPAAQHAECVSTAAGAWRRCSSASVLCNSSCGPFRVDLAPTWPEATRHHSCIQRCTQLEAGPGKQPSGRAREPLQSPRARGTVATEFESF